MGDGGAWAMWWYGGGEKRRLCHLGLGDRLSGYRATGRDGSGVSGLWMIGPFTESGKTSCRVDREGELGLDPDELGM